MFDLADRISVMLQGKLVGTVDKNKVTKDEVLGMIILGKLPGEVTEADAAALHLHGLSAAAPPPSRRTGGLGESAARGARGT